MKSLKKEKVVLAVFVAGALYRDPVSQSNAS